MGNFLTNKYYQTTTRYTFSDIIGAVDDMGLIPQKTNGASWFYLEYEGVRKIVDKQKFVDLVYQRLAEKYSFEAAVSFAVRYYLQ